MLSWAGIDFGEDNTLRLQKSIKVSTTTTTHSTSAKSNLMI